MTFGEDKEPTQNSHRLVPVDIELQKQSSGPAPPGGDHAEDDAPLLGESGDDAGAGDMVSMPVAAWLLLAAAVGRLSVVYVPGDKSDAQRALNTPCAAP